MRQDRETVGAGYQGFTEKKPADLSRGLTPAHLYIMLDLKVTCACRRSCPPRLDLAWWLASPRAFSPPWRKPSAERIVLTIY